MRSGALPWVVALLLTLLAWQWYDAGVARSRARVEGARADEYARQVKVLEADAAQARAAATAYADSVVLAREEAQRITADAQRKAATARQAAVDAEGRVRTALDSLGASTDALDVLVEAHAEEIAAVQEELGAVRWERDVLASYADRMEDALRTADAVADGLRWEVQSLRRQVELMDAAHAPSWQTKAGVGIALAGVLALVVAVR